MDLKMLKENIDRIIDLLPSYQKAEDIPVLITLSSNSVGARASCEAKYVGMGIDWEGGQFRIEPSVKLVKIGDSLIDVKPPRQKEFSGRKYYTCQRCECKISRDDKFCRQCGQRLR